MASSLIRLLLSFLSVSILSLYSWMEATFGADIPPGQVIFHLLGGVEGVEGTDFSVFQEGIHSLIVTPLAITIFLFSLVYLLNQITLKDKRWGAPFIGACILTPAMVLIPAALINQWIAINLSESWNSLTFIKRLLGSGFSQFSFLLQHQMEMGALFLAIVYAFIIGILVLLYFLPFNDLRKQVSSSHIYAVITMCLRSKITYVFGLVLSIVWFFYVSHFYTYLKAQLFGEDYFTMLYFTPKAEHIKALPKKPKNLILIYVESLERGLMNSAVYGENLIAPIDRLPGHSISQFPAAPGTTWSMAGMVASQCALPLRHSHVMFSKNFLPNALCLGDILSPLGYEQYFLVGPELNFANMDRFYFSHGYQHAYGRDEWAAQGLKAKVGEGGWGSGLSDDMLLEQAKKIVTKNKNSPQPYVLTLITTDNHNPNGFPSKRCEIDKNKPQLSETFKCNSKFIAHFFKSLEQEGLLNNTIVVLMGDHPFAVAKTTALPFPNPRNVYFRIFGNEARTPTRDAMTHFDVAPTILDSLGILQSPDQRMGLGYSLYSTVTPEQYEAHLNSVTKSEILNPSIAYELFWLPKASSKQDIVTGHSK